MSCDSAEYGRCSICSVRAVVTRKYYYYDIKCECCLTKEKKHFEIVWYCEHCTPVPPRRISAVVTPLEITDDKE